MKFDEDAACPGGSELVAVVAHSITGSGLGINEELRLVDWVLGRAVVPAGVVFCYVTATLATRDQ